MLLSIESLNVKVALHVWLEHRFLLILIAPGTQTFAAICALSLKEVSLWLWTTEKVATAIVPVRLSCRLVQTYTQQVAVHLNLCLFQIKLQLLDLYHVFVKLLLEVWDQS